MILFPAALIVLLAIAQCCVASKELDGRYPASKSEEEFSKQQQQQQDQHLALPSTQAVQSVVQRNQPAQAEASIANAKVQTAAQDMQPAAAGHYGGGGGGHGHGKGGHGKYYMYAESPKKGAYKAGFSRGNHKHHIQRKEYQHKSHAGGYMKWSGKKGKGSHKWEFTHYDKKGGKGHY